MTTARKPAGPRPPKRRKAAPKPAPKSMPASRRSPAAVGAAILGVGALLGAAAVKLFRRTPTVGSAIARPAMKRLKKLI